MGEKSIERGSLNMDKNKTKQMYERIVKNIQTIIDNGEYEKFLKFRKNFKDYSFNNLVLIFSQFPEATMVAGKAKWLKLKRELQDDAQKIFILAPIPRKYDKKVKKVKNGEEIETFETVEYNWYRYVYVYDISQTKGEDLPLEFKNLNSDNMANFYEKLKHFSKVPVIEQELNGTLQGYYSKKRNKIAIKNTLSIDDKVATLLHEIAHSLYDDFDYKQNKYLSEIFVESIAYIVADNFGLDTSVCSFNYITQYTNGDTKDILALGSKIQKCANEFIKELENFEMQQKLVA